MTSGSGSTSSAAKTHRLLRFVYGAFFDACSRRRSIVRTASRCATAAAARTANHSHCVRVTAADIDENTVIATATASTASTKHSAGRGRDRNPPVAMHLPLSPVTLVSAPVNED